MNYFLDFLEVFLPGTAASLGALQFSTLASPTATRSLANKHFNLFIISSDNYLQFHLFMT